MASEIKVAPQEPSNAGIYIGSAVSILLSLFLLRRNPVLATFVGLWPPTILGMGTYFKENKIMEMEKNRYATV